MTLKSLFRFQMHRLTLHRPQSVELLGITLPELIIVTTVGQDSTMTAQTKVIRPYRLKAIQ